MANPWAGEEHGDRKKINPASRSGVGTRWGKIGAWVQDFKKHQLSALCLQDPEKDALLNFAPRGFTASSWSLSWLRTSSKLTLAQSRHQVEP